jgi:hypothetical protein
VVGTHHSDAEDGNSQVRHALETPS